MQAYENAKIYKENTKCWHDGRIKPMHFEKGEHVLLLNSRLKLFPGNLRSRWTGPYEVVQPYDHGVVQFKNIETIDIFKVNGQRLKDYLEGDQSNTKNIVLLKEVT
ncbi:hypothetical protein GQ457_02G021810 [Hibiscus cannabinus]